MQYLHIMVGRSFSATVHFINRLSVFVLSLVLKVFHIRDNSSSNIYFLLWNQPDTEYIRFTLDHGSLASAQLREMNLLAVKTADIIFDLALSWFRWFTRYWSICPNGSSCMSHLSSTNREMKNQSSSIISVSMMISKN